jgi:tRNA A-37 threonylcarbamoyl transferase component Bud32/tetratricopeptide (TPR) repeat protein
MPFSIGENVGPYRIVEKLGQGGMATVFKAYHPSLDRYVAIKVMHPALQSDPNFLARFQREARIVARLDHPNIVPVYDFAEHRGHPYLVMRFVEGETLKAHLQREPFSTEEALRLMRAVGDALAYAHGSGVLHRDIKPSNVILTPEGHFYLTDFGVARMAEAGESTLSRDMMVGTPQYIAPEQAKGETNLDARTDIYSLGVVLYELLVGRVPFQADTPYAVIHDHIFTPLPMPRSINPAVSESLERVLLKALAKEREDRFQSVEELVQAVEAELASQAPPPLPATAVAPVGAPAASAVVPEAAAAPPAAGTTATAAPAIVEPSAKAAKPARAGGRKRRWPWILAAAAAFLCVAVAGFIVLRRVAIRRSLADADATQLLEAAHAAQEEGAFNRALTLYEQAAEADPQLEPAYVDAADLLWMMGDREMAMEALTRGLDENPESPMLHQAVADFAMLEWKLDPAWQAIDWLVRNEPAAPAPHAYLGVLILADGRPCGEARPEFDRALEADPELAWAHFGLGICNIREGHPDEAIRELAFVLEHDDVPEELRARAAYRLSVLEQGLDEPISEAFTQLQEMSQEIAADELRTPFEDTLGWAKVLWDMGDGVQAVRILHELNGGVEEYSEMLGPRLARRLTLNLIRLIELIEPR